MLLAAFGLALLAIVIFLIGWSISTYNRLVRLDALSLEGWSGMDVQLKRRYDLIPNLVATVKQYSIHEKETLENIAKFRNMSMGAQSFDQKMQAEAGLTQALKSLFAVVENYPELKANENFLSLQKDLGEIERELQLARRYYNGATRNYNIVVDLFPSNMVARFSNFTKKPYFEITAEERGAPKVEF